MNSSGQIVPVDLGSRSYEISIASGQLPQLADRMRQWLQLTDDASLKCFVITDSNVLQPHANAVRSSLTQAGAGVQVACVPSGERSKSIAEASDLYDQLVDFQADRRTVVVAVGGGVVGDLAGFVAATYARGLRFVQVPTTLLSMVDSSVGGKTGVNHPKGKNLIGAFHQPAGVMIDTATLDTLPDREYRSGLAEVVKYGVILDEAFFAWLEDNVAGLNERSPDVLQHVVARSCELKAYVVKEDEYETSGLRAILNYGHTYAHAFEALSGYGELLHGEAVAIGMICGSRLAHRLGRIDASVIDRQVQLLQAVGLPTEVPTALADQHTAILDCMLLDKKTVAGDLKFVLPDRMGHVETTGGIAADDVTACLTAGN